MIMSVLKESVTVFNSAGHTTKGHTEPVAVPLFTCVCVASCQVPTAVVVIVGVAVPVSIDSRCAVDRL